MIGVKNTTAQSLIEAGGSQFSLFFSPPSAVTTVTSTSLKSDSKASVLHPLSLGEILCSSLEPLKSSTSAVERGSVALTLRTLKSLGRNFYTFKVSWVKVIIFH